MNSQPDDDLVSQQFSIASQQAEGEKKDAPDKPHTVRSEKTPKNTSPPETPKPLPQQETNKTQLEGKKKTDKKRGLFKRYRIFKRS